jgi:hypothetical protein
MEYTLVSPSGNIYAGTGDTLNLAIKDALTKLGTAEFTSIAHAKSWCIQFIRQEVSRRKDAIFSASANYDQVELVEMMAEARDYRITGNTTAARYPLASALATARGVTMVSILTAWGNALTTAFGQLATLIDRQDRAETAIGAASTMAALRDAMTAVLEEMAG